MREENLKLRKANKHKVSKRRIRNKRRKKQKQQQRQQQRQEALHQYYRDQLREMQQQQQQQQNNNAGEQQSQDFQQEQLEPQNHEPQNCQQSEDCQNSPAQQQEQQQQQQQQQQQPRVPSSGGVESFRQRMSGAHRSWQKSYADAVRWLCARQVHMWRHRAASLQKENEILRAQLHGMEPNDEETKEEEYITSSSSSSLGAEVAAQTDEAYERDESELANGYVSFLRKAFGHPVEPKKELDEDHRRAQAEELQGKVFSGKSWYDYERW